VFRAVCGAPLAVELFSAEFPVFETEDAMFHVEWPGPLRSHQGSKGHLRDNRAVALP
jgi:hypothetical protein